MNVIKSKLLLSKDTVKGITRQVIQVTKHIFDKIFIMEKHIL